MHKRSPHIPGQRHLLNGSGRESRSATPHVRDRFTWAAYGSLLAFGLLNASLGPALPYLRDTEDISYLVGALHQLSFSVGGGAAGLIATRRKHRLSRRATIRLGLAGAAAAGLGVGYGDRLAVTVPAALAMSFLNTSALIALWASLSDAHQSRRAVAMTEGEVAVSLGGVIMPLLVAGLASTSASWRSAFAICAGLIGIAVLRLSTVRVPRKPAQAIAPRAAGHAKRRLLPQSTLVVVFAIVGLEFGLNFWLASYLNVSVDLSRQLAVVLVSVLYGANLGGRLVASRLARDVAPQPLLAVALSMTLIGLPLLIAASSAILATLGIVIASIGIGAMFPLASSLHVASSACVADRALGQVLAAAAIGQTLAPLLIGALAQATGLRSALLTLPALTVVAIAAAFATAGTAGKEPDRP